jgi:hypothetical protein
MAWIRWRGASAQLLATVWVDGKNRQRYLGSLGEVYSVTTAMRAHFEARYPTIRFDWAAIDRRLAQGPPATPPLPDRVWDWATVEQALRDWAASPEGTAGERATLEHAADVLREWRAAREQQSLR